MMRVVAVAILIAPLLPPPLSVLASADPGEGRQRMTMGEEAGMPSQLPNSDELVSTAVPRLTPYSFYDELRESASSSGAGKRPLFGADDPFYVGRNLHAVSTASTEPEGEVLLCHVPTMLRYSDGTEAGGIPTAVAYAGGLGALLAVRHFNDGVGAVVPSLDGLPDRCPIRLTTELIDTAGSGVKAVQTLTKLLTRPPGDVANPQPCALFGSQISSVTSKLATLAGAYDLPQISSNAMSTELDDQDQYPTFARTHTDAGGFGTMAVSYLVDNLGVTHAGLLVPNDSYGLGFQRSVLEAAAERGREVSIVEVQYLNGDDDSVDEALRTLKDTGYNYFIGAFYAGRFADIMSRAGRMGLAGPGKFWLASGGAGTAPALLTGNLVVESDSDAARAIAGSGLIFCKGGLPGVGSSYDRFSEAWRNISDDEEFREYALSKQPEPPPGFPLYDKPREYFRSPPNHIVTFSYDALIGLGLSACNAWRESFLSENGAENDEATRRRTADTNAFTGRKHYDSFVSNAFRGSSGDVEITGQTRTARSSYFVMANLVASPVNATHSVFKDSPVPYFYNTSEFAWKGFGPREFVYPGNTTAQPMELPPMEVDYNHIEDAARAFGLFLASAAMALSLGCSTATAFLRNNRVIVASQPIFLQLIAFGTLLMASTVIPLSLDDSILTQWGCDVACMASPWAFSVGFVVTFSALFAKTHRVNRLCESAAAFRRIEIKPRHVMRPLILLLTCNVVVLSVWTALSPLRWERTVLRRDAYGRPAESIGYCASHQWLPYVITLALIDFGALITANIHAYRARNVDTRYSEARYIAFAMASIFQVLLIGIPLMVIVRDDTTAYYFMGVCIVFVVASSTIVLIFVPKFHYVRVIRMRGGAADSSQERSLPNAGLGVGTTSFGSVPQINIVTASAAAGMASSKAPMVSFAMDSGKGDDEKTGGTENMRDDCERAEELLEPKWPQETAGV